ncbi:MAG TPA: B12-binding domain-containing radical SAM protein [Acetivibrio sp.]|uniref:B12-binding domain-containing radical SAM protein n=1 Tax=Acetivibrio sp. TaxID=1872092 RepID=UPI002C7A47E7|nr:B12-binding domain-containing radical SAM protein [Acetivibrio sp.]HOM02557.1 B12-binding domain-containing radical SAM protein [Acetivibrio sp.]
MKTRIIGVNSKYIHSSLAAWYLKASCDKECGEVRVMEFTINDNPEYVLSRIYTEGCDVAAFSCYIWNIGFVLKLAENLKMVLPEVKIILGGPEVSFDPEDILRSNWFVDYVMSGEGEGAFGLLLRSFIDEGVNLDGIEGLSYRKDGKIHGLTSFRQVKELDTIPSPYTQEMLEAVGNRIIYFESSRGCPFSCSYCISSTFDGVRYFSLDRVKSDLLTLINAKVRLVKFVDRTFNCNRQRAKEIFTFIIENARETSFHFEAAADLFDEEMFDILSRAPKGLIQFEIGIQSTNEEALEAVRRKTDIKKVLCNIKRLKELGNMHIHVDLIAGLPFEDYNSFINSFNEAYELYPHQLQLGFLKLLKGSGIRREHQKYGYKFRQYPPYEILSNAYLSFGDIVKLKKMEELLERYYNSGRFQKTLKYLIGGFFPSPAAFFEEFSKYYEKAGNYERSISARELYTILLDFISSLELKVDLVLLNELLKFDFLVSDNTNNLPKGVERLYIDNFSTRCFEFLKNTENVESLLPEFSGVPAKKIYNKVHFEAFRFNVAADTLATEKEDTVILFDYSQKDSITGHYRFYRVELP